MSAFLFTAMPGVWDGGTGSDWFTTMASKYGRGKALGSWSWSTHRVHGFQAGDRAYLLLQGSGRRGIIGSGFVKTGEVTPGEDWANSIEIEWDAFIPTEEALPTETLKVVAPSTSWRPGNSGTAIKPQDEAAVEAAWARHLAQRAAHPESAPRTVKVDRGYTTALHKVRLHQQRFRALLLQHYAHECAYCGTDLLTILEAAHLVPDAEGGEASVENGRLLCANHHRALDAGLIKWNGKRFTRNRKPAVPPLPSKP